MEMESSGNHRIKLIYMRICGFLFFSAVVVSMGEIIARVFFHTTYDFVIDYSIWATVWAMLLLVGPVLAEGGHVSIDFIRIRLRGKSRFLIETFNAFCTLAYGATITWGGIMLVYNLHRKEATFPRYFAIPMWIIEICVPISMGLFTFFAILLFYRALRSRY